jgi:hypothetical protein
MASLGAACEKARIRGRLATLGLHRLRHHWQPATFQQMKKKADYQKNCRTQHQISWMIHIDELA